MRSPHWHRASFSYNIYIAQLTSPFPSPPPGAMQPVPPATVAEWTLQGSGNLDTFDGARASFHPPPSSGLSERGCICSLRRAWIQYPHEYHPLRERLFCRFVPSRPEPWMSRAARRAAELHREHDRVQERLRCQSGQQSVFVVTVSPPG